MLLCFDEVVVFLVAAGQALCIESRVRWGMLLLSPQQAPDDSACPLMWQNEQEAMLSTS